MNELYHWGILGMKWGVRRFQNADGSLTPEGKKRYLSNKQVKEVHKVFQESSFDDDVSKKIFKITGADKKAIDEARSVLKESLKQEEEIARKTNELFKGLKANSSYFEAVSEIASYGDFYDLDNVTLEDVGRAAYQALYDDGQQSKINAYSMYAYKNGFADEAAALYTNDFKSRVNYVNSAAAIIQDALNDVGGETLSVSQSNPNYKASKLIAQRMLNSDEDLNRNIRRASYNLVSASHASIFTDKDKENIAKAEKIAKNIQYNDIENTWRFFNEAIENLNLESAKVSSLSSSDWDRINKEIAQIKYDMY